MNIHVQSIRLAVANPWQRRCATPLASLQGRCNDAMAAPAQQRLPRPCNAFYTAIQSH
jgi:hypothetical protein